LYLGCGCVAACRLQRAAALLQPQCSGGSVRDGAARDDAEMVAPSGVPALHNDIVNRL